jgi:hypothetical protein
VNVFVVAMVRPGGEVRVVELGHDVRLREVEQVGVALDVARVVAQQLAAVVSLGEPLLLQQHAPGAVEDAIRVSRIVLSWASALTSLLHEPAHHTFERSRPPGAGAL